MNTHRTSIKTKRGKKKGLTIESDKILKPLFHNTTVYSVNGGAMRIRTGKFDIPAIPDQERLSAVAVGTNP